MILINRAIISIMFLMNMVTISQAKPLAVGAFCQVYPDAPACSGSRPFCQTCHASIEPVKFNAYGGCVISKLNRSQDFYGQIPSILKEIEQTDCDGDGASNIAEVLQGTLPGDASSAPEQNPCGEASGSCQTDYDYVYKKLWFDFCGEPPSWKAFQDFSKLSNEAKQTALDDQLDLCLDSQNWLGRNGVLWQLGHSKIRPVGSIKAGEDKGIIPILDYDSDYHLYVWAQIDGNDARESLLADYSVSRIPGNELNPDEYSKNDTDRLVDGLVMQVDKRVGLLTTFWNLAFYQNFTAVPRVLTAQTFRAFLGITMATYQGLIPSPTSETGFADYDKSGVTQPECAVCHTTIDPATYPFKYYNGLPGVQGSILSGTTNAQLSNVENLGSEINLTPLSYALPRINYYVNEKGMTDLVNMPETGYVLGQRVNNLREWAQVVTNSDLFAAKTVTDYWVLLIGEKPRSYQQEEFRKLWQDFSTVHEYSVEAMLHDLIKTEAYRVR
ncbi:MAG: hypothetical protein CMP10_03830 [Zetaproteobacteria bacterium]|nr:hypothetical protein [Pseudobdellovibrionaceae bacterium]